MEGVRPPGTPIKPNYFLLRFFSPNRAGSNLLTVSIKIRLDRVALAYCKENALNAIYPYFTMFPLEYPDEVLKRHRSERPIVPDPFCGRGVTLFSARKFGFESWDIDTSPVAVAIAKAKLASRNRKHRLSWPNN